MSKDDQNQIRYVFVGTHSWSKKAFEELQHYPGEWHFVSEKEELMYDKLSVLAPRYVFFLHWSWMVPDEIVTDFECICFHMTDLPYGRGGSPLQNLILEGHEHTVLTAFRMTSELDAGDVYLKRPLDLSGRAEDIYHRAAALCVSMVGEIIETQPRPTPQQGTVSEFIRRKPSDSEIPTMISPHALYDFIRMLDAEGYPHAYIEHGNYRIEFRNAQIKNDIVDAQVTMKRKDDRS